MRMQDTPHQSAPLLPWLHNTRLHGNARINCLYLFHFSICVTHAPWSVKLDMEASKAPACPHSFISPSHLDWTLVRVVELSAAIILDK